MGKCPKCERKIEDLNYNSKVAVWQKFSVSNGEPDYGAMEDYGEHYDETYCCPYCDKVIATNEKDAIKILHNRKRF